MEVFRLDSMDHLESLEFPLEVDEDWPPASAECIPMRRTAGGYEVLISPLFVKGLSVGDVIDASLEGDSARVLDWRHVCRSNNSTVWLMSLAKEAKSGLARVLGELRGVGCTTVESGKLGAYAINVPEAVSFATVDGFLASLDPASIAVAFPSMRHSEPDEGTSE